VLAADIRADMGNALGKAQEAQQKVGKRIEAFKQKKGIAVTCMLDGLQSGASGGLLGLGSFYLSKMNADAMAKNPNMSPDMRRQMEMMSMQPKSLGQSMVSFAVLLGVQKGLTTAFKHYRKEDDVWNACALWSRWIMIYCYFEGSLVKLEVTAAAPCSYGNTWRDSSMAGMRHGLLTCRVGPALGAGAAYGACQGNPAQIPVVAFGFAAFSAIFHPVCF
jgi:hypothetical protein